MSQEQSSAGGRAGAEDKPDVAQRREELLKLVDSESISTQKQLVELLCERGYSVTQSGVSRDIRELGLRKRDGTYFLPSDSIAGPAGTDVWRFAHSVGTAGDNLVVIRCRPATAQPLASAVDQAEWDGVVGTIAGDDTVFVAVDGREAIARIRRLLFALLPSHGGGRFPE